MDDKPAIHADFGRMKGEIMKYTLADARAYEEKAAQKCLIKPKDKPAFHLTPRIGWMNDPNGFSFYQGKYHMFYQYYPYGTNWGPMHWGHAVSTDLLHWEDLPCALAPDQDYDYAGCFSGSAVELEDGSHLLMYTGVSRTTLEDGSQRDVQIQCLAKGDGTDYVKLKQNPVLTAKDLPDGASPHDFRDPKIWRGNDGLYRCAVANRPEDGSGQILLYTSKDAIHWKYDSVLVENGNRIGKMWECPDFFEVDGKWVLLTSPQDMEAVDLEYRSGNGSICLIGEFDEASNTFTEEIDQAVDYGIDFYAHQSVLSPDGRRIMIGWMQNWDTCCVREDEMKWFGQTSLPRELHVKDGRVFQTPIQELETLRTEKTEYQNILFKGKKQLDGIAGRKIDLEVNISAVDQTEIFKALSIRFAADETHYSEVKFTPYDGIVKIDRRYSGSRRAAVHESACYAGGENGNIRLRMILDRNSAEIFINNGEKVMTMTIYTPETADGIYFLADGQVNMDVVKYSLG